jgi:hypothetical protein
MVERVLLKKISGIIISISLITLILFVLIPPATAVILYPGLPDDTSVSKGTIITFNNVNLTIRGVERIPVEFLNFSIFKETNDERVAYVNFSIDSTIISQSPDLTFTVTNITNIDDLPYDTGSYGYGYDENGGTNYSFGTGYGYGYGDSGYTDVNILYTITYKTHLAGTFYAKLFVNASTHTYASDESSMFTVTSGGGGSSRPVKEAEVVYVSENILDTVWAEYGIRLTSLFYAYDTNGDGVVDTFIDPNHILTAVHFVNINDNAWFLISTNGDNIPEFFWDATTSAIIPVHHDVGIIIDTVDNPDTKTITITISVEKANWTYIEVTDLNPDNPDLIVKTADGRTISSEMIWRQGGKIFILDDPVTEYQIIYSYVQEPLFDITLVLTPDSVSVGADISALITLINVGEPGLVNGTVNYTLYKGAEIVWSSEEIVTVSSQKTYTKTISTKGLKPGSYIYKVIYSYTGGQTASAQGIFIIEAIQQPLWENILLWAVIIIILIIIVILAVLYKLDYLHFDKKEK